MWDPSTGTILPAGYSISASGTTVPLQLTERQSLFVVFRNKTANNEKVLPRPYQEILATVTVPWEVSFPAGMGAPEKIVFDTLKSWTLSSDDGVKYFSGTAEYSKTLELPKSWFKQNGDFFIDLGNVGDIAEISVNGASAGILWKPPCRTNRLAGDQKAGQGKKVLNSPLFVFPRRGLTDSGLLGPVTILKN